MVGAGGVERRSVVRAGGLVLLVAVNDADILLGEGAEGFLLLESDEDDYEECYYQSSALMRRRKVRVSQLPTVGTRARGHRDASELLPIDPTAIKIFSVILAARSLSTWAIAPMVSCETV